MTISSKTSARIAALDLIRGVAVLGILAINIAGFAGPPADVYHPVSHGTPRGLDAAVYAAWLVLCEGKMRALFAILFGASMELFIARADAAGRNGQALQLRRLLWLGVFGYLHWLLWWGDILFSYALAGLAALMLRQTSRGLLLGGAAFVFCLTQADAALDMLPLTVAEAHVAARSATPAEAAGIAKAHAISARTAATDLAQARLGFVAQAADKLRANPLGPLWNAIAEIGEALPYMLLGIVLYRAEFFVTWPRARLVAIAVIGLVLGGLPTIAFAQWAMARGFPFAAMHLTIEGALGPAHLAMALGYAALLVIATPWLMAIPIGRRLAAAGRMAFSNYLGTSIVMTALFCGWGLHLVDRVGTSAQAGFVLLGWALMLGVSAPWLARFRQGPLEWAWRSLVEWRALPLRR